jgi:tetratricopeptide (TPR) repeat protein
MKSRHRTQVIVAAAMAALVVGAATTLRAFAPDSGTEGLVVPVSKDLASHDLQIAAYSHALEVDPASAVALGQLAGLYLQRARETGEDGDYRRAVTFARRSLDLRVNRNAKTFVTLATALMAEHEFAEAEKVARLAVQYDPTVPQYRALLAEAQLELGNYEPARETFNALGEYRGYPSIASRLARWHELNGDVAGAFRIMRLTVEQADSRRDLPIEQVAWFHYRLGDMEMRNGKFRRARTEFERGLKVEPADYRILGGLAKLSLLEGNPARSIEYSQRAIALKLDPALLGVLGEAFLAAGDTASSEENLRVMEVAVRGQPGAYHRAWSLFLLDHGRRLQEVNANALAELTTRKDIYGYDIVAWSFYRLGRAREADPYMRLALQLGTRDPVLYYHAGMIEKALGHNYEASRFLGAALEINPSFDYFQSKAARTALDSLSSQ